MTMKVRFGMNMIDIEGPVRAAVRAFKTVRAEKIDDLIAIIASQFETGISGWTVRQKIVVSDFLTERGMEQPREAIDDIVTSACLAVYREGHRRDFAEAARTARTYGRILKVRLIANEGACCARSKELAEHVFEWGDAPKLPLSGCKNRPRCGCSYMLASSPLGDRPA